MSTLRLSMPDPALRDPALRAARDAAIYCERQAGRSLRAIAAEFGLGVEAIRGAECREERRRRAPKFRAPLSSRTRRVICNLTGSRGDWTAEEEALRLVFSGREDEAFDSAALAKFERGLALQVAELGRDAFLAEHNCGERTVAEIEAWLEAHGLVWSPITAADPEAEAPEIDPRDLEALAYACDLARQAQAWWERDDRRDLTLQWLRSLAASTRDCEGLYCVDWLASVGWDLADRVMQDMIIERLSRGERLPLSFTVYAMKIADHDGTAGEIVDRLNRGPPLTPEMVARLISIVADRRVRPMTEEAGEIILRTIVLAALVDRVCLRFGLNPLLVKTSKKSPPRPSGCRIVAGALMEEGAGERNAEALKALEKETRDAWWRNERYALLRSAPFFDQC